MIYLDTNVLLYATLTHVDTPSQQDKAINILKECIGSGSLVLSNLNLLEYAFVMSKAKEEKSKIENALGLFQAFVKDEKEKFSTSLMRTLDNDYAFRNSFDIYHVVFAHAHACEKIITFDQGFKKFQALFTLDIEILNKNEVPL